MIRFAARGLLVGVALPLLVLAGGPGAAAQSGTPSATASPATAGDITIYRDEMGVPHVYADTAPAVFFGGSYAIAQDRLAQSELESRALLGRLAEVAGPSMIEADKTARIALPTDASMQAQYDRLPADYQAIMKGMYDGWIKRVREVKADPALLPYEFKEWGIEPTEWTMLEFLKVMGMVFKYYGTGGGGRELTNLALYKDLVAKHGEADAKKIFDDMLPLQDPDAVPIFPAAEIQTYQSGQPRLTVLQGELPLEKLDPAASGPPRRGASRVILIGADKSASGNTMILQATADGPDLHLSGGGFEAAGYVFPTMSPIIQGRTDTFAWSATTGEADVVDIYAEKLNSANPRQYYFNGAWRDMTVRKEVIRVRGAKPVTFEIESTVHGPVIHRENKENVAYTVKNAMADNELSGAAGGLEMNRAKTFEDYKSAASKFAGNTNANYAGSDGNIAIMHVGMLPIRPQGIDPRLPTPGTGEYEWQGFIKDFPMVMNPKQGYLHAWNNKSTANATYGDSSRYGKAGRTWLGRMLVEQKGKLTREDLHEIHRQVGRAAGGADLTVTDPRFFTRYLRRAVQGDAKLEAAVEAMDGWNSVYEDKDGDGYYDSPGLTVYRTWIKTAQNEVIGHTVGDWWHKIEDESYIKYQTDVLLRAIEGSDAGAPMTYDWYKGRSKDAVLRKTVADTVAALEKQYGTSDVSEWRQRIFYFYYDPAAQAKNPDKPTRSSAATVTATVSASLGRVTLAAGRLGLQPPYIPDNGSENWNMLVEVKKGDPVLYDSTPTGGQNLFVSTEGKGNPNIADQVKLHETFEFKKVDLDRAAVEREAVSTTKISFSGN